MCFWIFNKVCLKHLLFKEDLTRYYDEFKYVYYKIPDILDRYQRKLILFTYF